MDRQQIMGGRGDGEAGPEAQGEVGKAGGERGSIGPIETNEMNAALDVANVASAQTMSNLEAGVESSSLGQLRFTVSVVGLPIIQIIV